jgi:hypothetical protein
MSAAQRQLAWWITKASWIVFDALHAVDTGAGVAGQALVCV